MPLKRIQRQFARSILIALLSSGALFGGVVEPNQPLFIIERTTNRNFVRYEAVVDTQGRLDTNNPVVAFWIMAALDGRREELSAIEKRRLYGFTVKSASDGSYNLTLAGYSSRPLRIFMDGQTARAEVLINGTPAILQRVFLTVKRSLGIPRIVTIEFFGKDSSTGADRYEKFMSK